MFKSQMLVLLTFSFSFLSAGSLHAKDASQNIEITVTDKGFEPKSVDVKPGTDVTLQVTRKSELTCATQIQVPSKKILKELPLNKTVTIDLGVVKKGEIRFGCSENMMESAKIVVR